METSRYGKIHKHEDTCLNVNVALQLFIDMYLIIFFRFLFFVFGFCFWLLFFVDKCTVYQASASFFDHEKFVQARTYQKENGLQINKFRFLSLSPVADKFSFYLAFLIILQFSKKKGNIYYYCKDTLYNLN